MKYHELSPSKKRKLIIFVTVFLSIILYLAGVYSGLYANKILEKKTKEDIKSFREETEQDINIIKVGTEEEIENLRDYIDFLKTDQSRLILEQEFVKTLTESQVCDFYDISMDQLLENLNYYWQRFPFRLESYEKENQPLSEEYLKLKEEYTHLSIRTWTLAKTMHERCNTKLIHGFNFYSGDCSECTKQGEQLDSFSPMMKKKGFDVIIFTIDLYSEEPIIKFIKKYYNITSVPSLFLNGEVYKGKVFEAEELIDYLEDNI